ncbi:MAG: hypothetical protein ACOYK6_03260 [Chthoniobacterales bacterium]
MPRSFLSILFLSLLLLMPALGDDSDASSAITTSQNFKYNNSDGSTTDFTFNPDGTSVLILNKLDGSTIKTTENPDGSLEKTIDRADGVSITTTDKADFSSSKMIIANGSWIKITKPAVGLPTVERSGTVSKEQPSPTPSPSASASPSPSASASASASPSPSASASTSPGDSPSSPGPSQTPSPTPSPTPPPSKPLEAPFYIDRIKSYFAQDDPDRFFLISKSCITAEQWVAFLNAVAKYGNDSDKNDDKHDKHQLYYPSMGTIPQAQKDAAGNITIAAPKRAVILSHHSSKDSTGYTEYAYAIVDPDKVVCTLEGVEIKNKDLPITYINLADAARFCNWLHHGEPIAQKEQDPDAFTEGGAYLIDDGLDKYWRDGHQSLPYYKPQYVDCLKTVTLLSTALWRIPSYYHYNGVHHLDGKNKNIPDFIEPGDEFANQPVPSEEVNGFFDNGYKSGLEPYIPYEWTSTHSSSQAEATKFHCELKDAGNYYKVRSPSNEVKEYATTFKSLNDKNITKEQDSETSFRVMPLLSAIDQLPPTPAPSPSPDKTTESSPDAAVTPTSKSSPGSGTASDAASGVGTALNANSFVIPLSDKS